METMKKSVGLALGVLAACVAFADCPHWISVMPLNGNQLDELAHDCADLGNTTFIDGIA